MSLPEDGCGVAAPAGSDSLVFAAQNIGMGLTQISACGFSLRSSETSVKRRGICAAILDGHIAEGLVNDEDGFRFGWGA